MTNSGAVAAVPLCVDLDGTLIRTDMLWESTILLLQRNPLYLFLVMGWALKGRARLKKELATRVTIAVETLPYNHEFVDYLNGEKGKGRLLVLVTAADRGYAEDIARHLNLFREVMSSDGVINLKGNQKRKALEERFGSRGYDYAGNSTADLPSWGGCHHALLVNAGLHLQDKAAAVCPVERVFPRMPGGWIVFARAIRVHQWVKNALVFLPVITAHRILEPGTMSLAAQAALAFSLCASSVYLLNDLTDLTNDRVHATKRKRPIAAGDLSIPAGLVLIVVLVAGSVIVSLRLPHAFQFVLALYYVLTFAYSIWLKRRLLVDIFTLAGLYTLRVLAGSAATGIEPSPWLLAFCLFFFLGLALVKRFTELKEMAELNDSQVVGRGYRSVDLPAVGSLGTSSGFMCVLVLALYINSPQVAPLYRSPWVLWFLCPLALYWISRLWVMAYRGTLSEDPVLFALRDRISYLTAAVGGAILVIAARGVSL